MYRKQVIMKKTISKKKILIILIISFALLLISWNYQIFGYIAGKFVPPGFIFGMETSTMVVFFIIFPLLFFIFPAIMVVINIITFVRLKSNNDVCVKKYRKYFLTTVILQILYFLLIILSRFNYNLYPDASTFIFKSYYYTIGKHIDETKTADTVIKYLEKNYNNGYSFEIVDTYRWYYSFGEDSIVNFNVMEKNSDTSFTISYNNTLKKVDYNNFKDNYISLKVNKRLIEIIDECLGEDITLYIRWDGMLNYKQVPMEASADDVLNGKYGQMSFSSPIIFIRSDSFDIEKEKDRYISILKNFCIENMVNDREYTGSKMNLYSVNFSLYCIDSENFDKYWKDKVYSGEADQMRAYTTLSASWLNYLLNDSSYDFSNLNDVEKFCQVVRQKLYY